MNIYRFKPLKIPTALCSLVLSALLLNACGGGSVASVILSGIGGTGIVFGPITAFGSVYVNGNKFEIIDSEFDVDGNTGADQSNLRLGMVVKLEVETENGVYTGKALKVSYDDEIQGPVEAAPVLNADGTKNLTVLGQTIIVDEIGTVFDGTDFDTIAQGDIIEVSGFRTPTAIEATFLEKKSPTTPEVELRGNIAGFTTGGTTFQIGIVTINFVPGTTDIDVPGGIDNGKYVEIEGVLQNATTVLASSIEEEDEDFGESVDDISMQGVVADMASGISNFLVGSQRVDASGIAGLTLMDGMNIKVEGKIEGSKLIADEVEIRDSDTKLRTFVNDVIPGNTAFRVNYLPLAGTVTVRTNAQTLFEDKTGVVLKNFSVDDLAATDFVRIEGQEVNDEVVASVIKRVDSVGQDLKLEGAVDSHFDNVSITILGIEYVIDPGGETGFEQFGDSSTLFFAVMEDGDFVEIEDKFPANGIADEVELE